MPARYVLLHHLETARVLRDEIREQVAFLVHALRDRPAMAPAEHLLDVGRAAAGLSRNSRAIARAATNTLPST